MARKGRREPRPPQPLPPPLPPDKRTVGQLVAETVAFYRHHFFQTIPLGLSVAALTQLTVAFGRRYAEPRGHPPSRSLHDATSVLGGGFGPTILVGALFLTGTYIAAFVLVTGERPDPRRLLTGYATGVLVFLPAPIFAVLLGPVGILPAVAYLAFAGWSVPAVVVEGCGFRESLRRSTRLARVDYVHAIGGLATLVIVFYVTRLMLALLIRGGGELGERSAALLSDLVLSPMLFVGSAILYVDQAARFEARK